MNEDNNNVEPVRIACDTCLFLVRSDTLLRENVGWCVRFPPQVVKHVDEDEDYGLHLDATRSPFVEGENWCGEWQPNTRPNLPKAPEAAPNGPS
jgi:hypothetical protein